MRELRKQYDLVVNQLKKMSDDQLRGSARMTHQHFRNQIDQLNISEDAKAEIIDLDRDILWFENILIRAMSEREKIN